MLQTNLQNYLSFFLLDEPTAVKLVVYSREKKLLAEMYLCSVEADPLLHYVCDAVNENYAGSMEALSEKFTVFPLLLCRGTVFPRNVFFDWLKVRLAVLDIKVT